MAGPTEAEIRAAAEAVARIGRVGGVAAKDGAVQVSLEVDPGRAEEAGKRAPAPSRPRLPACRASPAPPSC